ncbi:MAG: hypothetical protein M3680_16980 [Myxococcota bacterium]|nr:hypothetical protein [Myxococcota bacterium]
MHKCLALLVLLAACPGEKEDYKKAPPPEEPVVAKPASEVPPAPKQAKMPADLGTCTLTASGAVTAEQTTPGGRAATNVSYWFDEAERKNMMGVDGFVVNCQGPSIQFSLVPGGGKVDGMPFSPKKYEFKKGKADANVMVSFGKAALTQPDGVINITAFDGAHIAGTIDLTGKLLPGGGQVKLTGSFDLACPGFKGCVY